MFPVVSADGCKPCFPFQKLLLTLFVAGMGEIFMYVVLFDRQGRIERLSVTVGKKQVTRIIQFYIRSEIDKPVSPEDKT